MVEMSLTIWYLLISRISYYLPKCLGSLFEARDGAGGHEKALIVMRGIVSKGKNRINVEMNEEN